MFVIKKKNSYSFLYCSGNTYKVVGINNCSTYLSESGARSSLTKHKSVHYLKALHLTPDDFEVREVTLTLNKPL